MECEVSQRWAKRIGGEERRGSERGDGDDGDVAKDKKAERRVRRRRHGGVGVKLEGEGEGNNHYLEKEKKKKRKEKKNEGKEIWAGSMTPAGGGALKASLDPHPNCRTS